LWLWQLLGSNQDAKEEALKAKASEVRVCRAQVVALVDSKNITTAPRVPAALVDSKKAASRGCSCCCGL
jgi:hypothetical protein